MTSLALSFTYNFVITSFSTEECEAKRREWKEGVENALDGVDLQNQEMISVRSAESRAAFEQIFADDLLRISIERGRRSRHDRVLCHFYSTIRRNYELAVRQAQWTLRYYEVGNLGSDTSRVYLLGAGLLGEFTKREDWEKNFLRGAERLFSKCQRICVDATAQRSKEVAPLLKKAEAEGKETMYWEKREGIKNKIRALNKVSGDAPSEDIWRGLRSAEQKKRAREILHAKNTTLLMGLAAARIQSAQTEYPMHCDLKKLTIEKRGQQSQERVKKLLAVGRGHSLVLLEAMLVESKGGVVNALSLSGYDVSEHSLSGCTPSESQGSL